MSVWADFYITAGGAAAALTGLLFIAVSLRPREIRTSALMVGRARSAFYAFATITFVALLATAGTGSRWVGLGQAGVALGTLAASVPFTAAARSSGVLNYRRAAPYHSGLVVIAAGGLMRAAGGNWRDYSAVVAVGTLALLAVALSNSWQLVISHEQDDEVAGAPSSLYRKRPACAEQARALSLGDHPRTLGAVR